MRLLLDTHALLWWSEDNPRLGAAARDAIRDGANEVYVSAVSAFEIGQKYRMGKLPDVAVLAEHFPAEVERHGFAPLPIELSHARRAGTMDIPHKDPFDRLLIAQAREEGMTLVSNETVFDGFDVQRLW